MSPCPRAALVGRAPSSKPHVQKQEAAFRGQKGRLGCPPGVKLTPRGGKVQLGGPQGTPVLGRRQPGRTASENKCKDPIFIFICSENADVSTTARNRKPLDKASLQGTLANFVSLRTTQKTQGQVLRQSARTPITKVARSGTRVRKGEGLRLICRGLLCFLRDMVAPRSAGTAERRLCFAPLRASAVALRRSLLRLGSPISGRRNPHDPPAL